MIDIRNRWREAIPVFDGDLHRDGGSNAGCAGDANPAAHPFGPFADAQQSEVAIPRTRTGIRVEAAAVVVDVQHDGAGIELPFDANPRAARMFDSVGDSLLANSQQVFL